MKNKVSKKYQHSVFVQTGGVMKRIDVDAIVYIEANSYKCLFYMEDGTRYVVSMPMCEAIEDMDEEQIVRIHRSYSVNIDQIDEYWKIRRELTLDAKSQVTENVTSYKGCHDPLHQKSGIGQP